MPGLVLATTSIKDSSTGRPLRDTLVPGGLPRVDSQFQRSGDCYMPQDDDIDNGPGSNLIQAAQLFGASRHVTRITVNIRVALREIALQRVERDSHLPFMPEREVSLIIDVATGRVLSEDDQLSPGQETINVVILVNFDDNRIRIEEDKKRYVEGMLGDKTLKAEQRSIFQALKELDGKEVIETNASSDQLPVDIEPIRRRICDKVQERQLEMTIAVRGIFGRELMTSARIGIASLDSEGHLIGLEVSLAKAESAWGRIYKSGVGGGSSRVPMLLTKEGDILLINMESVTNDKQKTVLLALINSPENQAGVADALENHPYMVDIAMGRGPGAMLTTISRQMRRNPSHGRKRNHYETILHLVPDGKGGQQLVVPDADGTVPIAAIKFQARRRKWKVGKPDIPGVLSYELLSGSIPPELEEAISFLQKRVALPIEELIEIAGKE